MVSPGSTVPFGRLQVSSPSRHRSRIRPSEFTIAAPLERRGFVGTPSCGPSLRIRGASGLTPRATFRRSPRITRSRRRLYRTAAGWYVDTTGTSSKKRRFVRASFNSSAAPTTPRSAAEPNVTPTFGRIAAICVNRYGRQASSSSARGERLPGGRHFTAFVMKTEPRGTRAASKALSRILPAAPTNGRPDASSSFPGASPTITRSESNGPSPGTACVRPTWRRQRVHARIARAVSSRRPCESASAMAPKRLPRSYPSRRLGPHLRPEIRQVADLRLELLDSPLEFASDPLVALLGLRAIRGLEPQCVVRASDIRTVSGFDASQTLQLEVDLVRGGNRLTPSPDARTALTPRCASGRSRRRGRQW